MKKEFIVTNFRNIKTGFILEDGKINEIRCYEDVSLIGNIYVGRVTNVLNNIDAAFVEISKGIICYLPLEDVLDNITLKIGDFVVVQVKKDALKTKKATVTMKLSVAGKYSVVNLDSNVGVSSKIKDESLRKHYKDIFKNCTSYGGVIRTNASKAMDCEISDEIKYLSDKLTYILDISKKRVLYSIIYEHENDLYTDISDFMSNSEYKVITDIKEVSDNYGEDIYYDDDNLPLKSLYNINKLMETVLGKKVFLKSGGYLIIENTEAMTVIDVNSGKAIKGSNTEEVILKLNIEAATEIARQLRLRNTSGIIIIDFINMKQDSSKVKLVEHLKNLLLNDHIPTQFVDITKLGLVELTRKKIKRATHEVIK